MTHFMIDIETLGTAPGSVILSIGAVRFDPAGTLPASPEQADPKALFLRRILPQSCLDVGLRVDGATLEWWLKQKSEIRADLFTEAQPLRPVLRSLSVFLGQNPVVWGHGATFDPPLLAAAYLAATTRGGERFNVPWKYTAVRDTRTLFALAYPPKGHVPGLFRQNDHTALGDAYRQARAVQKCMRELGLVQKETAA